MIVRLAQAKDEAAILELAEMQVRETLPHLTFSPEITRATFRRSLTEIDPTLFVAEEDGRVVGLLLALVCPYAMATGFFTSQEVIYVKPDRRGTRAAAELAKAFNDWSDHLNASEVYMGVANGRKIERFILFVQRLFGFDVVGVSMRRIRNGQGWRKGRNVERSIGDDGANPRGAAPGAHLGRDGRDQFDVR